MITFLRKHAPVIIFLMANLAIATPASAASYRGGICPDGEGNIEPCCVACFLFCGCDVVDPELEF